MIQVAAVAFFQRRRQKVRVLAIDEKSLVKGRGGFSTIVSNAETGAVIAVLPGRCEAVLASFLSRQSREWRVGVKVVCTDMANCYRAAIRTHLPTAAHVVDRFHVTRNFCQVLCDARREAQRTRLGEPHDPALFKARYVLVTRMDRLTADQGAMLAQVLADHPELGAVWEMTQRFYRIYEAQGIEEALGAIEDFATAWMASNAELGSAVKTLLAWENEWLNFHRHGRASSGCAEGINNKIEVLERKATAFDGRSTIRPGSCSSAPAIPCAIRRPESTRETSSSPPSAWAELQVPICRPPPRGRLPRTGDLTQCCSPMTAIAVRHRPWRARQARHGWVLVQISSIHLTQSGLWHAGTTSQTAPFHAVSRRETQPMMGRDIHSP